MPEPETMEFSTEAIEDIAGTLRSVRMMLETVPSEALVQVIREVEKNEVMGPMLDPTKFMDPRAFESLRMQKGACALLIKLKKLWRQDVPLADRIQEELDRGAPERKQP